MDEIKENAVYTSEETQSLLNISRSTFMRLIKKEILRANKIGGQYRVLGREMLRLLLPEEEFDKVKGFVKRNEDTGDTLPSTPKTYPPSLEKGRINGNK